MIKIEITKERYIYKYFTINEYLLRTLINNELYFSCPSDFNDPFDCQFKLELVKDSIAEEQFYENLIQSGIAVEDVKAATSISEKNSGLENKINDELRKRLGVLCFSEKSEEILMWSHYADSHRGVCLIFDWKIHEDYFKGKKVKYDNNLPTIRYSEDQKLLDEATNAIMVKLDMWSYEKEIRSVIKVGNDKKRTPHFNPKALAGVIFGERVTEENIQIIKRIVELHEDYCGVKFFKAKLNRKKSKIEITPYNIK